MHNLTWPMPDPVSEWKSLCIEIEIAGRYTPLALHAMGIYARGVHWALNHDFVIMKKAVLFLQKQQLTQQRLRTFKGELG